MVLFARSLASPSLRYMDYFNRLVGFAVYIGRLSKLECCSWSLYEAFEVRSKDIQHVAHENRHKAENEMQNITCKLFSHTFYSKPLETNIIYCMNTLGVFCLCENPFSKSNHSTPRLSLLSRVFVKIFRFFTQEDFVQRPRPKKNKDPNP